MEKEFYHDIKMPRTSQEYKARMSLANDEKSIEDITFKIKDINKYQSSVFEYALPRNSQEFKERISL